MTVPGSVGETVRSTALDILLETERRPARAFDGPKLIDEFEILADASGGTTKLRELVLGLAVRGVLVRQEPDDGDAADLLRQLATASEASRHDPRREGELQLGLSGLSTMPWTVPPSWRFVRLEQLSAAEGVFSDGDWVESKDQDPAGEIRLTQLADVGDGTWRDRSKRFMNRETADRLRCTFLEAGDILIARMPEPIGRACIFPGDVRVCATVVDVAILRVNPKFFDPRFAAIAINSNSTREAINLQVAGTTRQRISRSNLARIPVPVAPLAEQKRIVTRVHQLMTLIDELDARLTMRREISARFARASLRALTTNDEAEDSTAAWKRVVDHLPIIVDRWEKVGELRNAVLDLAVQGRLVQQDEHEGTAQPLVEQCPSRQREQEASGRFKPSKRVARPINVNIRWLPASWRYECLGNLCRFIDYRGKTPQKQQTGVRLITAKNVRMGFIKQDPEEFIAPADYARWMTRGLPVPGDLLFTTEAPMGNVALFEFADPVALAQRIIALHPYCDLSPRFLMFVLMSPWFQSTLASKATGMTATGIKASKLKELPIPLAPREEQDRIVAKVERMMRLCDELEATLRQADDSSSKLVEALVAQIVT